MRNGVFNVTGSAGIPQQVRRRRRQTPNRQAFDQSQRQRHACAV